MVNRVLGYLGAAPHVMHRLGESGLGPLTPWQGVAALAEPGRCVVSFTSRGAISGKQVVACSITRAGCGADMDTSGVLLFAKAKEVAAPVHLQFR